MSFTINATPSAISKVSLVSESITVVACNGDAVVISDSSGGLYTVPRFWLPGFVWDRDATLFLVCFLPTLMWLCLTMPCQPRFFFYKTTFIF